MKPLLKKSEIKATDKRVADYLQLSSYELMQKAGQAVFSYVRNFHKILIVAGAGNNAGDGFIIAKLALEKGINTRVWALLPIDNLPNDAKLAAYNYIEAGGQIVTAQPSGKFDCIVDAIFGTGLSRNVEGLFAQAIDWINLQKTKVVAVDIPSGLDADTGQIKACAVIADITVCVIAFKPGLITNYGKDICGLIYLEDLDVPQSLLLENSSQLLMLESNVLKQDLFKHPNNSHKGSFGQALIVGGHDGMLGALILAGRAALQSGCGLVEVVSNSQQAVLISLQCPELITAIDIYASRLILTSSVIGVGPGLGLNQQSKETLQYCIEQKKPMVVDADALTLIANQHVFTTANIVLTPHPKEAARLLNTDVNSIQKDRIASAILISKTYRAVVVLKGSGTVIANQDGEVAICPFGYSGMATAGMGDVLTGIIVSLMAQGFEAFNAAKTGVIWHALAAEKCNKGNCLIATDVIKQLAQEIL